MRHQSRGLVDDDDVVVAIDHLEGDVLGEQLVDLRLGHVELEGHARPHRVSRAHALAGAGEAPVGDEPLDEGA